MQPSALTRHCGQQWPGESLNTVPDDVQRIDSVILGAAAEHFVMSKLLRRGLIAALPPAGVPNCDICVTDRIGDRLCSVQVKARRQRGSDGWHMGQKHETLRSPSLLYVFVDFGHGEPQHPVCYVVPSVIVAEAVQISHKNWLAAPRRSGHIRKDSKMRRFLPDYSHLGMAESHSVGWLDIYREQWGLLETASRGH